MQRNPWPWWEHQSERYFWNTIWQYLSKIEMFIRLLEKLRFQELILRYWQEFWKRIWSDVTFSTIYHREKLEITSMSINRECFKLWYIQEYSGILHGHSQEWTVGRNFCIKSKKAKCVIINAVWSFVSEEKQTPFFKCANRYVHTFF